MIETPSSAGPASTVSASGVTALTADRGLQLMGWLTAALLALVVVVTLSLLGMPLWVRALGGLAVLGGVGLLALRATPTPPANEQERRQRQRNKAIALALFALVAVFYIATMTRLKGNALNKPAPYINKQPIKVIDPASLPQPK